MGARLCALRHSDPSKVDGTMRHESIVENQSNPAGTSTTVAASLLVLIKSASCFKRSTSINGTASSTTATGSVNVCETSKKKAQSSIDQYVTEIVDKVMTKNGDQDQAAGTRTLGEWIIASPAPKRRVDYALRKSVLNPWVPRSNSSMGVITNSSICSTKKRSVILRRGAHNLNEDHEYSTHDFNQQHAAGDRPLLLISPTGTAYNNCNNWELSLSGVMNNIVHHDVDGEDDAHCFRGARDSICIAKARRRVAMQGRSATRSVNHGSAAVVKMKKKVSFRLPEEADIFFFYSPPNNIDHKCSVGVNGDHNCNYIMIKG